jgi:methyl-accepting chemotaxis protein
MTKLKALDQRLKFIGLDGDAAARLQVMKPMVMGVMSQALDHFYDKVNSQPETRAFFTSPGLIAHAKAKQTAHWEMLSSGRFDEGYLNAVTKVGEVHAKIGLEPRWYIAGYAMLLEQLAAAVLAARWPKGGLLAKKTTSKKTAAELAALIKTTFLDMDLAISVYLEALETSRLAAERKASETSAAVMRALGAGLAALASGDLTHRLRDGLPPEYAGLRDDFNAALDNLQTTMRAIGGNAQGVRAGADEMTSASDDLSRRTEQQAASLEETAAALDEITATVKSTAEGAAAARKIVSEAKEDARHSSDVVRETVTAMSGIEESSRKIGNIIGVIDEIAFQTNLLALNAGVEAARAGDAGRGFVVVATEVRALAQRSAEAAKEIKALISASGQQVETGVKLVGETGKALDRIVGQVDRLNGVISGIASSTTEQSTGMHEINTAVNQMDQVTQQNAAMVEQSTAASHHLLGQADELSELIGKFQTGAEAGTMRPSRPPARKPVLVATRPAAKGPAPARPAPARPGEAPPAEARAKEGPVAPPPRIAAAASAPAEAWDEF